MRSYPGTRIGQADGRKVWRWRIRVRTPNASGNLHGEEIVRVGSLMIFLARTSEDLGVRISTLGEHEL